MATKKIILNELRNLVKQIINEETEFQFKPAIFNNKPSITDGTYHYYFAPAPWASDHSALYAFNKTNNSVVSYDIVDEFSSIKSDPELLAAYKELSKQYK